MYLIAGLGNPGKKYEGTKHNMGFDAISYLADKYRIPSSGVSMKGVYGKGRIGGQSVILLKPMTYMNLSGESIQEYVHYYKIDPETELIVIYDDIDLDPGQIRVRKSGSPGSHNGMKNIVQCLGTNKFMRVRIGTGAKPDKWDLADYVLAPFDKEVRPAVNGAIERAGEAVAMILEGDVDKAMSTFNRKVNPEEKTESSKV
ncbi:MAG: aminoacyl-tRNA hydrolase [Eubacterium sp.]|nr:aminoacyl-tRNA hydrolase [Eubacterium sp.]